MPTLEAVEYNPFKGGGTPEDFSARYGAAAEKAGKALGVDPSVILGQWGLETGWGKSIIPGTNNLGNIKDMSGSGVAATDNMTGSRDKYRAYDTPDAFVDDYVSLLQRKYPGVMNAGADPMKFTGALKGYAEDPQYANKVSQATRMVGNRKGPVAQALDKATDALIPSASAATLEPVDFNPFEVKQAPQQPSLASRAASGFVQGTKDLAGGLLRGAGSLGSTLLLPGDAIQDVMAGRPAMSTNNARRAGIDAGAQSLLGANPDSFVYGAGKLTGELAGTAGVGPALGIGARAMGAGPAVVNALSSGGMTLGTGPAQTAAQGAGNLLLRAAGGAVTGGASAGLVNPQDAATGALIGGALPVGTAAAGKIGKSIGNALTGGTISPEVKALAQRAEQLGIDVPADRIANSKPLNALASSLEYVPFSGRTATMDKMQSQFNTALSKTFGQNSDNVTAALRKASGDLGAKFDQTLKSNVVNVDPQFMTDLQAAAQRASKELGSDGQRIIQNQIDEILQKGATGQIDGQAAYNIKRTLDQIGKRNTPEAYYADDLRRKLMDALNRSLGPQEAAKFAEVRKQYGNMLTLQKLAQNGAEGDISIARVANLKNINNPELQEIADVAAQFLKSREGAHGAAQRTVLGVGAALGGGLTGTLPAVAGGMAGARLTNSALNSSVVRNRLLSNTPAIPLELSIPAQQLLYRGAPVVGAQ